MNAVTERALLEVQGVRGSFHTRIERGNGVEIVIIEGKDDWILYYSKLA